jgi:hypothetical protein
VPANPPLIRFDDQAIEDQVARPSRLLRIEVAMTVAGLRRRRSNGRGHLGGTWRRFNDLAVKVRADEVAPPNVQPAVLSIVCQPPNIDGSLCHRRAARLA